MSKPPVSVAQILPIVYAMSKIPSLSNLMDELKNNGIRAGSELVRAMMAETDGLLKHAMEARGLQLVGEAPIQEVFEKVKEGEWNPGVLSEKVGQRVYERMDAELSTRIKGMNKLPYPQTISDAMKEGEIRIDFDRMAVDRRLKANALLVKDIIDRSKLIVNGWSHQELFTRNVNMQTWACGEETYSPNDHVNERKDAVILEAAYAVAKLPKSSEDNTTPQLSAYLSCRLPGSVSISNYMKFPMELKVDRVFVKGRLKTNAELNKAVSDIAATIIDNFPLKDLFCKASTQEWNVSKFSETLAGPVYARIDGKIGETMQNMTGRVGFKSISNALLDEKIIYSHLSVENRINANVNLFFEFYKHRGMTDDQIVGLLMEKKGDTPALRDALAQRLRHLEIFRECAFLEQMKEMVFGSSPESILEISVYPAPLLEARKALGQSESNIGYHYLPLAEVIEKGIPCADSSMPAIVFTSSIHRIKNGEQMGRVLAEAARVLSVEGRLVCTYPLDYSLSPHFNDQMQGLGLPIQMVGERTTCLPRQEKEGLAGNLIKKVSGESTVLVMQKVEAWSAGPIFIDPLIKAPVVPRASEIIRSPGNTIDVPVELNAQLVHIFSKDSAKSDAIMLSLLDENGKLAGVCGLNMNPKKPGQFEYSGKNGVLNTEEKSKIGQMMKRAMSGNGEAGLPPFIQSGKDTTIRTISLKQMLRGI